MKVLFIFAAALLCLTCNAAEIKVAYPADLEAEYSIVSVEGVSPNRIVVLKIARTSFTTYVKREFDCLNSKVRYLGSSNNPIRFDSRQEDKYFSSVDVTTLSTLIWSEVCQEVSSSLTASQ
ncbi:hypothetical protein ACYZTM_01505 [Pseudomonas sp. MDT2-39-1]